MKKFIVLVLILAIFALGGYYLVEYVSFEELPEAVTKKTEKIIDLEHPETWKFAVVGDNEGVNDISEKFIEEMGKSDNELVVNVGDLVQNGEAREFKEMLTLYEKLEIPWYPTLGNNDMGSVLDYDDTNYRKYVNEDLYYSFKYKNALFIILDNANRTIGFDDTQLAWLDKELKNNTQDYTFIFFHKPFKMPLEEFFGDDETPRSRKSNDKFVEIISKYHIDYVFAGHVHNYLSYSINEIPVIVTGGGGAAPQDILGGEQSAYYHYIEVIISNDEIDYKVMELD
ncbi:metallophosphoesterase [Patescibacteria group bacterium]|nr:metallophosphoesterase [Patescibacteria group bacterium]